MNKSRSMPFILSVMLITGSSILSADTVTDASLKVRYTATSTFAPSAGNTYDVFLTIDPTGFNAGSGFLTAVAIQFKTGSDVSRSVTLVAAPGGTDVWSPEIPGGLNSDGCNGKGTGFVCFQNLGANTVVPGGPYNFEMAVAMPGSDALTAASDVKAAFNTAMDNSGKNLGLGSMGITIQPIPPTPEVPEPSSFLLLGSGLFALPAFRKLRKSN